MDRYSGDLAPARLTGTPPFSLGHPQRGIADSHCDALPDHLYTDPLTGQHPVYCNLGNGACAPGTNFVAFPANVRLGGDTVQLTDLDGDGRIDLVEKFGGANDRPVFYPNLTKPFGNDDSRPACGGETPYHGPFPPFDFSDPAVRSRDLGNDKLMDFMRTTANGTRHWLTAYAYDRNDNLTHRTASQGNQKWFRYDRRKRKRFMNDPTGA